MLCYRPYRVVHGSLKIFQAVGSICWWVVLVVLGAWQVVGGDSWTKIWGLSAVVAGVLVIGLVRVRVRRQHVRVDEDSR